MPAPDDGPSGSGPQSSVCCPRNWLRENGLWTAEDDPIILERNGPTALRDLCTAACRSREQAAVGDAAPGRTSRNADNQVIGQLRGARTRIPANPPPFSG
jgi:hypothetical protein